METNQYRTSGVIDEAAYREISKLLVSRRRVWFTRLCSIVMGLFTLLMLWIGDYPYAVLFLAFTVLFAISPALIAKLSIRTALKRLKETYPEGYVQIETVFTKEGVVMRNLSSGGEGTLPYGAIRRLVETEHYFYLNTKANQFTLVFKNMLSPEQKQGFLPFLKGKCPQMKVVKSV